LAGAALLIAAFASEAWSESALPGSHEPAEQAVRHLIESIRHLEVVRDPAARSRTTESINQSLALGGVAEQALGPQWSNMSDEQRMQFVAMLSQVLERMAYPQASQFYSTLTTEYRGEEVTQNGTVVKTIVARPEGGAVSIDYLVISSDGRQKIADVNLDGQSLAQSISAQIQTALKNGSYELLMQQMQARLAQPAP
jgi:phospholipid transport system substrate-binding protein